MHEYSIVQALLERVTAEARQRGARSVHRLTVTVGELAGVETALLATAYDTFRQGTVCAEAPLDIRTVKARWECPSCGRALSRGAVLACADCGRAARLAEGDEIVLETVELEVP
ncbi:MAG TPA: hydrogenase maturation nickel metallochaperone HypA [Longimicrobiales bacterium]|nr:hydrogenase maturation nickel metallochaperone HypA [Longimicrobiales bacterium]